MKYNHIVTGKFIERPNRFIAYVEIDGRRETVHVKNTGRCKELLVTGATVYLEQSDNPQRKTLYDLIAVEKLDERNSKVRFINMDSQAPNKVVEEWLMQKTFFPDLVCVRPETKYGNSRLDFYVETEQEKIFIEVKGVTLENDGVVKFPDAPSERAIKHVEELIAAKREGYRVIVLFVIQMENVAYFTPNAETHKAFAQALEKASRAGVEILAFDCKVSVDELQLNKPVKVIVNESNVTKTSEVEGKSTNKESLANLKGNFRMGDILEVPKPLLKWYDSNRRVLPWREEPTPYRVWVSEIMLQQTRVEAVKPYFERFMASLPDIESLAKAEEETLLKLWEGLGYYNRVRNLQKAAIQIMEKYNGIMPSEYEELLMLKGIGNYTAGAISSIAYGKANPAVDGNVLRVLARIRQDARPISDAKVKTQVEQELREVLPVDRPGDFNQAMMEIGACVCVPNGAPHCEECPLNDICLAYANKTQMQYPKKAAAKPRTIEQKTVLIIQDENRAVVRRRSNKGLLAGMYEFPMLEGYCTAEEVTKYLAQHGLKTLRIQPVVDAKHIFSHKEWHMKGYMIRVDELEKGAPDEETVKWLYIEPQDTLDRYPIPAAFAAYVGYLNIKLGNERYREE